MKKILIASLSLLIIAGNGLMVSAQEIDDEKGHSAYMKWLEHVSTSIDLDWEVNETYPAGEACLVDDFDDGVLDSMWNSNAANNMTVEETDGVLKVYGTPTGRSYTGGGVGMADRLPAQSFTTKVDVLAKSGTFGGSQGHWGRHFGFFASGTPGHYIGIQYWANAYRISWSNGNGWHRVYASSNGDEMTTWYTWKIVYDDDTKTGSVFVGDRQIGSTVDINLGSFGISYNVIAPRNVWIDGNWDNFKLCSGPEDTTAPEITLDSVDPQVLWPPNGKMVDVNILGSATDEGSGVASVEIEVEDEYGQISAARSGFGPIQLESWRDGNDNNGRTYVVKITATDNIGNLSVKKVQVVVPHDIGMN